MSILTGVNKLKEEFLVMYKVLLKKWHHGKMELKEHTFLDAASAIEFAEKSEAHSIKIYEVIENEVLIFSREHKDFDNDCYAGDGKKGHKH